MTSYANCAGLLGANYSLFEEGWQSPDELLLIDVFHGDTGHLWADQSERETMVSCYFFSQKKEKKSDGDEQQNLAEPKTYFLCASR